MLSRRLWMVLLACLAVSLVCVAYPIYVIRPFRAQGERELAAALVVSRYRVWITVVSAVTSIGCAALYWRSRNKRGLRLMAVVTACFVSALAVAAGINVYELMFHPIDKASFAAASAVILDKDEKVIAVKVGNVARAYPIRALSYHHIANDVVDQKAIVATY